MERQTLLWLVLAGVGCIIVSLIWSISFPIIKLAWTSSYVLFAGGFCYLLFALWFWIIDVLGLRKWVFGFIVIEMNPVAVYSATMLFDFRSVGNLPRLLVQKHVRHCPRQGADFSGGDSGHARVRTSRIVTRSGRWTSP